MKTSTQAHPGSGLRTRDERIASSTGWVSKQQQHKKARQQGEKAGLLFATDSFNRSKSSKDKINTPSIQCQPWQSCDPPSDTLMALQITDFNQESFLQNVSSQPATRYIELQNITLCCSDLKEHKKAWMYRKKWTPLMRHHITRHCFTEESLVGTDTGKTSEVLILADS